MKKIYITILLLAFGARVLGSDDSLYNVSEISSIHTNLGGEDESRSQIAEEETVKSTLVAVKSGVDRNSLSVRSKQNQAGGGALASTRDLDIEDRKAQEKRSKQKREAIFKMFQQLQQEHIEQLQQERLERKRLLRKKLDTGEFEVTDGSVYKLAEGLAQFACKDQPEILVIPEAIEIILDFANRKITECAKSGKYICAQNWFNIKEKWIIEDSIRKWQANSVKI